MASTRMNNSLCRRETGRIYPPGAKGFVAAVLCGVLCLAARAANFTATLDRDSINLGETATLSLTFEGGQPQNAPTPEVQGLEFSSMGNSSSFSYNNGQMSSQVSVNYSVTAAAPGQYTIPAMTAEIGGQIFRSQPLTLNVIKPGVPTAAQINSGSQQAFMRLVLPDKKVFQGEIVVAQLQLFFRDDVQNEANFQFTSQTVDGFSVGKIAEGSRQRMQVGNRIYSVIPASVVLTVNRTGTLTAGPFTANVVILTGADQNMGPFGFFGGQQQQISMATEPVTVESLPLPTQNVPANFNGAIGDYTMSMTAGPTNVAVGDPITVDVTISGRGSLDSLAMPALSDWHDFKIFSPTSKVQPSDDLGDAGTKKFEVIVTPQNANVHELPELSFSYFNPEDGNYHTLTQPATPLAVAAVSATPLPTIATTKQSSTENQTPQDIVPIRESLGAVAQSGPPLITRPSFIALQAVPVLAFIAAFVWRKRTDNLANNPRLRRQRAVVQLVANGLNDLNKFAVENNSTEFFVLLFRLLQEQLGERLDCPAISITEADVDERLVALGAGPDTLNALRELFSACNQARYAPVQTSQELSALAAKFKKVAGDLQSLKV
jgi:hypothetical protein